MQFRRNQQGSRGPLSALLRQDYEQVSFGIRRFRLRAGPARRVLESCATAFLDGLNAVADTTDVNAAADRVDTLDPALRGFGYEGAAMGCALLDLLTASRGRRVAELLHGPARDYPHLAHVGIGWAYARLRLRPRWGIPQTDPLLRWLALDGFGFHQGFFHADAVIGRRRVERGLTLEQRGIRDQGLGRALWFHECADPAGIALRINEFPVARRSDLWSGAGLAATYAGGAESGELARLVRLAGDHREHLAQGCAFACAAHTRSGVVAEHVHRAAKLLAGVPVARAAGWTDESVTELGPNSAGAAHYEQWRAGIRLRFREHERTHVAEAESGCSGEAAHVPANTAKEAAL
ncbi:DUF1702 family protein [Amycolatopsis palatopharyngis]|uniref:DUF1702 family protein n=1 Tax=Amycolatopsis palatopharyngis TaxID=187982 RepID=UPI0013BEA4C4|nr:DUF1702 family protein [Amycolatopsis palatopharyngis]